MLIQAWPLAVLAAVLAVLAAGLWLRVRRLEAAGRADRETAHRLRAVLHALPFPVWWRDGDLMLEGANPAHGRILDPARSEPDGADTVTARFSDHRLVERTHRTGMPQSETHSTVVDGSRRLFEITTDPLPGGGIVGHALDRTDVEEGQAALAAHIDAHTDVLESLNAAIAIFGPDRRLRFFNAAFAHLWRIDRVRLEERPRLGELLELSRETGRLPEVIDFPAFKRDQDRRFTTVVEPVEELLHLPTGETLRATISPHPGGSLLFVYEDVTDRLALERSYNTLNAVQRESLNNMHEAVSVFGGDGRLRLWNPAWQAMWGFESDLLREDPHIGILLDHTRPLYRIGSDRWAALRHRLVLQVTAPQRHSGRFERGDGSVLDFAVVPLPDGGCLVTYIDVTDSVRVQRALEERNLALEKADKLKSQFIANVSYELRTPLNAIVGFSELLADSKSGPLTGRQRGFLDAVLQASTQLIALINDILDLATIEAGYLALHRRPVDLHGLLRGLVDVLEPRIEAQKLTLVFDCPDSIGEIQADPTRLRQAVFNLLSNALKFTPAGGTVTLAARRAADEVRIEVRDTGSGILKENLSRVFRSFERGDPSARESGAGLGLALTKSLVELHGGRIELDSAPGCGTCALCVFPATGVAAAPGRQVAAR